MADQSGKLTKQEKQKAIDWIKERGGNRAITCSVCYATSWMVGDNLVAPVIFRTGYVLGGPAYPQVMLICKNCGHTMLLNAVMMGLAEKAAEEGQTAEDGQAADDPDVQEKEDG